MQPAFAGGCYIAEMACSISSRHALADFADPFIPSGTFLRCGKPSPQCLPTAQMVAVYAPSRASNVSHLHNFIGPVPSCVACLPWKPPSGASSFRV